MMSDVPVLAEEIDRKTVETLEWIENARIRGKMTPEACSVAILTLWNATAGLVPKETMELMRMAKSESDQAEFKRCTVFVHRAEGKICYLKERESEVRVYLGHLEPGKHWLVKTEPRQFDRSEEAREFSRRFRERLTMSGDWFNVNEEI